MYNSNFYIIKRLFKEHIKPYLGKLFFAVICMMIVAGSTATNAWLIQPALDKIFLEKNSAMLTIIPLAVIFIAVIKGIATYFQGFLMKYMGQSIVTDMQIRLYEHLIYADLGYINSQSYGKLISRFTNDINLMRSSVSTLLTSIAKDFFTVIALIGVMFYQSVILSLIAFTIFPLIIIPLIRLGKRMRKLANSTQEELGNYTSKLDDTFHSIKVIKSFCQEAYEIKKAKTISKTIFKLYTKAARTEFLSSPLIETVSGVSVAAVIWYGGNQVINGITTPGSFFSFIIAFISAYKPMKSLADLNTSLQEGLTAARRLFTVLDIEPAIKDSEGAVELTIENGNVKFDHVTFSYNKHKPVLNNVVLEFPAGKTTALVGPSGGGKTTISNLLLRFYDRSFGKILIDDQDIKNVKISSLRKNISIVSQDVMLFDDTIFANIAYGIKDQENVTKEMVMKAAEAAAAHDFIVSLSEGYDTKIGQNGLKLSGGQRQRIAIARAILKDAPILILDEATSALDPVSEKYVQVALENLRKNRTTIIIAHRLSTIENADLIYVIKNGEVVEQGNHKILLEQDGEYAKLYKKIGHFG